MPSLLQKIERDAILAQAEAKESTVVEKMCRVELAADWPRPVELSWCKGRGSRKTILILKPGHAVEQPRDKCHAWFGPFDRFKEYEDEINRPSPNERIVEVLRDHIAKETARYLDRWGYPYIGRGAIPDKTPIGPHRSPDVTITVLNAEGEDEAPISLHEVYGVGKHDDKEFQVRETEEQIREHYEAKLKAQADEARATAEAARREIAELRGMFKGIVIGKPEDAKKEKVPA